MLDVPQGDVSLLVDAIRHAGWTGVSITRSIESIASSFTISVTDKWAMQRVPWLIRAEDECKLFLDLLPIITGIVDEVTPSFSGTSHTISVVGRSKAAELIDNSIDLGKWQFKKVPPLIFMNKIAAPFGVKVIADPATIKPLPETFSISPGETPFEIIDRIARFSGAVPVSDALGNVLITQPGLKAAPVSLVEGQNILSGSCPISRKDRYRKYKVLGQQPGYDALFGEAIAGVTGEAEDKDVRIESRVLVIEAEGATNKSKAKARAEWEKKVRAARSVVAEIKVQGWYGKPGYIWNPGDTVPVASPTLGLAGAMLISTVKNDLDESGKITTLSLVRPDAFSKKEIPEKAWKAAWR